MKARVESQSVTGKEGQECETVSSRRYHDAHTHAHTDTHAYIYSHAHVWIHMCICVDSKKGLRKCLQTLECRSTSLASSARFLLALAASNANPRRRIDSTFPCGVKRCRSCCATEVQQDHETKETTVIPTAMHTLVGTYLQADTHTHGYIHTCKHTYILSSLLTHIHASSIQDKRKHGNAPARGRNTRTSSSPHTLSRIPTGTFDTCTVRSSLSGVSRPVPSLPLSTCARFRTGPSTSSSSSSCCCCCCCCCGGGCGCGCCVAALRLRGNNASLCRLGFGASGARNSCDRGTSPASRHTVPPDIFCVSVVVVVVLLVRVVPVFESTCWEFKVGTTSPERELGMVRVWSRKGLFTAEIATPL